ncbi:MAG: glycosyl transferase [Rhodospirillales bacterium]|nr:glycosyl transferase [Rhodospirillales bacterium]
MKSLLRRAFGRARPASLWDDEDPVRSELFSVERLEQHAESLAANQPISTGPAIGNSLVERLADSERVLLGAYRSIAKAADEGRPITPAAEWLLDNYHLVEQQVREVRTDLPPGYYRQLPKLSSGPLAGYPRVFGVAWAFVAHTDSRFDPEPLTRFVRAYQTVQPLSIGELWAVAITLRIVLVENLRRSAVRIMSRRSAREEADVVADRLMGVNGLVVDPAALTPYQRAPFSEGFIVQLVQRLRDQDPETTPAVGWLEERLRREGTNADDLVRREHQLQGATNVTVRNIITSMRLISDVDWAKLFEEVSTVDDVLRAGSAFSAMDFATRNLYRTAIEQIARGTDLAEPEIARRALQAAASAPDGRDGDCRRCQPGYYLIGGGRPAFERSLNFRPPGLALRRRFMAMGIAGYVASVSFVAAVVLFLPLLVLVQVGLADWQVAVMILIGLLPAIDAALMLVNRAITGGFGATLLPGLDLREGVPPLLRTLVAIPTLLTTRTALDEQIQRLEVHYLANPRGALHFALLSDWADANAETIPGDAELVTAATDGIVRLNGRYPAADGADRFLLLHRRRVWNEAQGRWMGWERKRGKLHELDRLLRGATDTTFFDTGSRPPPDVRYVVTLDSDTRLPRDAIQRLVGKMAHPLNRPRLDASGNRVVEGYGVLQPRVTPSLPVGAEGSLFQRIFSSSSGIDPYSSAVSDVYQDLFGEGSYSGKGIYDIDAFEAALRGRVPDNTMLSHDLFEGVFARSGLVSDIEVIEEFPARYDVAAARQHRWARGDWQLLPWLAGGMRGSLAQGLASPVTAIGFWKMFDNLRRTLSAPAAFVALLAGWTLPLSAALAWTGFVVLTVALPTVLPVMSALLPRHAAITTRSHLSALASDILNTASQTALLVAFLPHQAWLMLDAIGRTLYRLFVSRRRLLDWTTAAQSKGLLRTDWMAFAGQMTGSLLITSLAAVAVWFAGRAAMPVAAPLIFAWLISPAIARWVSVAPIDAGSLPISVSDANALRLIARRTWRFFETFVTAADNMLPPDNFQEDPAAVVAHRTSPTNIGLLLLSTAAAREFGWIGTLEAVERLEATLATVARLKRFRGHFANWYDTTDLRPLDPVYISSVDSGNLAGHLIALANTCAAWRGTLAGATVLTDGVGDSLALAREALQALPDDRRTHLVTPKELAGALDDLGVALLKSPGRLDDLALHAAKAADLARALGNERADAASEEMLFWVEAAQRSIESRRRDLAQDAEGSAGLERRLRTIEVTARAVANATEFDFLFNRERRLLSLGYVVAEDALDPSCYDLLASEARLASFMAIALGEVPARHWFRLGREVTPIGRGAALVSWSGSMFEYLMPSLVMRAPLGSLIEKTNDLIVRRHIGYAAGLGVPWGISESAYNARDKELTYQYSNFGVPGLGFKRGLSEDVVIAPYATALAAMADPAAATANFRRLAGIGGRGHYGFYEALDFTPSRLPEGQTRAIVRTYMAHHQGMTIVALANALLDGVMRTRFHAEPMIQATELLLQERTPRDVAVAHPRAEEVGVSTTVDDLEPAVVRRLHNPHAASPSVHLLSNGRYSVMLTGAGSGYSRWGEQAVTRWREDTTCDDWGSYVLLRDVGSGAVWSAAWQPHGTRPDSYDVMFAEDRAEFVRRDGLLTTTLDVVVSPEDNAEVRRVSIANAGGEPRDIELTSYAEIVLAPPLADAAHQAFSKLFVQTEYLASAGAILATRRRRSPDEPELWAAHLAVVEGETVGEIEIETDRARFLGRGNGAGNAVAAADGRRLSNTVGTVLDPVFALRRRVRIQAGGVARIAFWTAVGNSREALLDVIDKHQDANAFERATTLAWTQAQVQLRHLDVAPAQASLYQRLAGHVIYANPALRSSSDTIRRGLAGQHFLWAQGISGDVPIVLVRIDEVEDSGVVREMLRAREYWRLKGLAVDLVILNERGASYVQDLQVALKTLVRTSRSRTHLGAESESGGIFVLRSDLISAETRGLLLAVARVVLLSRRGGLVDQLDRLQAPRGVLPPARRKPTPDTGPAKPPSPVAAVPALQFFNGLGGFSPDGREYVTVLGPGQSTPAPWINVVSNPSFGFQVAAEGGGYAWSQNSRDNQLTPWSNDPVSDRPGEVLYVRDLDSGTLWTPTALPIRVEQGTYVVRHGRGYSHFELAAQGIMLELLQYVPLVDSIKISRLTIRNISDRPRRLSVTAFAEWVLGLSRGASAPTVVTERDAATGAIFARNPWNMHHGGRVAFADLGGRQTAWTADRGEFIGRNGTIDNPAALSAAIPLSQRVGAGLDPCAALQTNVELERGGATEVVFFLGQAGDAGKAQALIERYRATDLDAVHREVTGYWEETLGAVQVKTPDRAMDVLLNGPLLYQTLACRYWARSAFYQASGAYGFRDQLQDVMSLAVARPELAREHILRAAARQFVEGDFQHWWFPPAGQGVRTRISDDRAWLATVAAHYIETTGDAAILDEKVPFLEGPALKPGEHDLYFQPGQADEAAALYEHCARGLDLSLRTGVHGLPLMGTGDWNDGMNRVGEAGRGESVWLGWFFHGALTAFAPIASARNEPARAKAWKAHAEALARALDREGWDGDWYRRGFYDDGTPLGSAESQECRIDSIAQSWAAMSGAGNPARAVQAMAALDRHLVHRGDRLAPLFTPPFDKTALDPGYIKGYPPGIRENGGQYTHAAAWSIMGFAALGQGDKATELFALVNPINHTGTRAGVLRYKVEPYVVAADVYSVAPHVGRGGWTWYTGSAGWLYRAGIEAILGLRIKGGSLVIDPCIPTAWPGFEMTLRYRGAVYDISIRNPDGVSRGVIAARLDGEPQPLSLGKARLKLGVDNGAHTIIVTLGEVVAK